MPRYNFKEFLKDEGLEDSKHKSKFRTGWEGRDKTIDSLDELITTLRELSLKNFEKFEKERVTVVTLEETIQSNKESVAKASAIHEQNEILLAENKKINKVLEKISTDLATYHVNLQAKDERILELEAELAGK